VVGRFVVSGWVKDLELFGTISERCTIVPVPAPGPERERLVLPVVGARFGGEVCIGNRVRIDDCDFWQCADLDELRLVGADLFPPDQDPRQERRRLKRRRGPRLAEPGGVTAEEMASVCRQLRTNLEGRSNRPGAASSGREEHLRGKLR